MKQPCEIKAIKLSILKQNNAMKIKSCKLCSEWSLGLLACSQNPSYSNRQNYLLQLCPLLLFLAKQSCCLSSLMVSWICWSEEGANQTSVSSACRAVCKDNTSTNFFTSLLLLRWRMWMRMDEWSNHWKQWLVFLLNQSLVFLMNLEYFLLHYDVKYK